MTTPTPAQLAGTVPANIRQYIDAKFVELEKAATQKTAEDRLSVENTRKAIEELLDKATDILKQIDVNDKYSLTRAKLIRLLNSMEQDQ